MSLFKTPKKYQKESEQSVVVREKLLKLEATFPEVMKIHEANLPEIEKIDDQLTRARKIGTWTQALHDELSAKKRRLQAPLHDYKVVQGDLRTELERLTHFFITEKDEEWRSEITKLRGLRDFKEQSHISNIEGRRAYKALSNLEAVRTTCQKLLESLSRLHGMAHFSIPEIETFIQKVEEEIGQIDLTTKIIDQDEGEFKDNLKSLEEKPSEGQTETGIILSDHIQKVNPPRTQKQEKEGDPIFNRYDALKRKL